MNRYNGYAECAIRDYRPYDYMSEVEVTRTPDESFERTDLELFHQMRDYWCSQITQEELDSTPELCGISDYNKSADDEFERSFNPPDVVPGIVDCALDDETIGEGSEYIDPSVNDVTMDYVEHHDHVMVSAILEKKLVKSMAPVYINDYALEAGSACVFDMVPVSATVVRRFSEGLLVVTGSDVRLLQNGKVLLTGCLETDNTSLEYYLGWQNSTYRVFLTSSLIMLDDVEYFQIIAFDILTVNSISFFNDFVNRVLFLPTFTFISRNKRWMVSPVELSCVGDMPISKDLIFFDSNGRYMPWRPQFNIYFPKGRKNFRYNLINGRIYRSYGPAVGPVSRIRFIKFHFETNPYLYCLSKGSDVNTISVMGPTAVFVFLIFKHSIQLLPELYDRIKWFYWRYNLILEQYNHKLKWGEFHGPDDFYMCERKYGIEFSNFILNSHLASLRF